MLTHAALPEERQQRIRARLAERGRVLAVELAAEFGVSDHTIRRDLGDLVAAGVCKRVYGGAIAISPAHTDIAQRSTENTDRKDALGRAGAALLRSGQCVFLDAGSTNLAIARAISPDLALTVATNSPAIAHALMASTVREVILLGGRINANTGGALGITALQQLQQIYFDQCFLGVCALDADEGLTAFDFDDAEFKRALIARSGLVTVAVTNEKLSSIARYQVASCAQVSTVIVEYDAPQDRLATLRATDIDIIVAS